MGSSHRWRILMLLQNNPYPQDTRVRHEAQTLSAAGYQVTVIAPSGRGQPLYENVDGVHTYRYPPPPSAGSIVGYLGEYAYSMTMSFLISLYVALRHGFDAIHAHNPPDTFVFIALFYKLFGKRYIYDQHDLCPELYATRFSDGDVSRSFLYRTLLWVERLNLRFADHTIATNQSYKRVQMERGNIPEERISIVRNGPDLRRMRRTAPPPELQARYQGLTVFGYLGIIGRQDGVDYLLRALSHLVNDLKRSDFVCLIIGKGDALPELKALATTLGLNSHVQFTGWVSDDDLVPYLSLADIFVDPDPSNPLNDKSTMTKMMDYMAMGRPIVAFDLPEQRYSAQEAALYVTPNDERQFAVALQTLMDDPERRRRMGEIGRRRVEQELAWQHSAVNLLHAYSTLLPIAEGQATHNKLPG